MLQRWAMVHGGGAAVSMNEEGGERKEVVHMHQCHTTRAANALMRMERPYVALATCKRQRRLHTEMAMVASARLRRDLQRS